MSQPTEAAPMLKYVPISGIDKLSALPEKLVMNAVLIPTKIADRCRDPDDAFSSIIYFNFLSCQTLVRRTN